VLEHLSDNATPQANIKKWTYHDPEKIEIGVPRPPSEPIWTEQSRAGTYTLPAPFVCEVSDVRVLTRRTNRGDVGCVMIDKDDNIIIETAKKSREVKMTLDQLLYESGIRKGVQTLFSPFNDADFDTKYDLGVPLIGRMCMNFGHWFQQYLPSLRGVEAYEQLTGEKPRLILNPNPPQWMCDSLKMVGYSNDDWCEISGKNIKIDRAILPSQQWQYIGEQNEEAEWGTKFAQAFSKSSLNWVREQALNHVSEIDVEPDFSENVYISRSDAASRRIANENELMDRLTEYGFQRYVLSELSLFEQVKLFSNAKNIVGPIGSGFTNILYAEEAKVLVISAGDTDNGLTMAEALGHDFACIRCDYEQLSHINSNGSIVNRSDLIVDIDDLLEFMRQFEMISCPEMPNAPS
jgi:hypothetical protein